MLALLVLVLWPVAELFVAIKVADAIGVLATVALLLAAVPIGVWLLHAQGRVAWRRLGTAVQAGRLPAHEAIEGALVLAGGMLLIVPGFISDALGLFLLLAPTRALARAGIARNFTSRFVAGASRVTRRAPAAYDVDSTATSTATSTSTSTVDSTSADIDSPRLHR